jgi:hypothetical protein
MRYGITGNRTGLSERQIAWIKGNMLSSREPNVLAHGDCIGVDAEVHDLWASAYGERWVSIHPPEDETYRAFKSSTTMYLPEPYLDRNKRIVETCDLLVAFPDKPEYLRSGTWSTVRAARKIRKNNIVVHPDGSTESYRYLT